ncbi:MAG: SpoIVB peptidase S55 domain-containing protein [Myxococcota bacterium]
MLPTPLLFSMAALLGPSASYPTTHPDGIYELSEVQVGDRGVGYTVFRGDRIETFEVEVLGILEGFLGPGEDVILARLHGPRIEFTGVISGMSGSPVFVDDRLVGAVGYRFGQFSKEPIAGITPIRRMLAAAEVDASDGPSPMGSVSTRSGLTPNQLRGRAPVPGLELPSVTSLNGAHPIGSPFSVHGLRPEATAWLAERLDGWPGVGPVSGGGASRFAHQLASAPPSERMSATGDSKTPGGVPDLAIVPGGPVTAMLVKGDIKISALGTVTYVHGDQVLAFGHPFVGFGHVGYPLATASILNTVASETGSYKQFVPAREAGVVLQDRLTGIAGKLGGRAATVPLTLTVRQPGRAPDETTRVEIVDDPVWLPLMTESVVLSALSGRIDSAPGGSIDLKAEYRVSDRSVTIEERFSLPAPAPVAAFAANDVGSVVGILSRNDLEPAHFSSIDIEATLRPRVEIFEVQNVVPESVDAEPGGTLGLDVHLLSYRGDPVRKRVEVAIPEDARGDLEVFVGGASAVERREAGRRVPRSLDDLLGIFADRKTSGRLYAKVFRKTPGVSIPGQSFPFAPPSMQAFLTADQTSRRLGDASGPETSVPFDGVVRGSFKLNVNCRSAFR